MTTLTLKIHKDEDLKLIEAIVDRMGIDYEVNNEDFFIEDQELAELLARRDADYKSGKDVPITAEESERQIDAILGLAR